MTTETLKRVMETASPQLPGIDGGARRLMLEQPYSAWHDNAGMIERIEKPSEETFERLYLDRRKPVIIEGAARKWHAPSTWAIDYLKAKVGQKQVRVTYSPGGVYKKANYQTMRVADFLDLITSEQEGRENYYVTGTILEKAFPELAGDVKRPKFVDKKTNAGMSLFLGRDSITDCHFHPDEENVLVQIVGKKRVVMFSPEDFAPLYPKSFLANHYNWSRISFDHPPDFKQFPKFKKALVYEALLEPGDMLFIPVHWWHAVYGPDLSISGAFFWQSTLKRYHFPGPGLRCCLQKYGLRRHSWLKALIPDSVLTQ